MQFFVAFVCFVVASAAEEPITPDRGRFTTLGIASATIPR
jgi:hypothetical protein